MLPGISAKTVKTFPISSAGGDRIVFDIPNDFNTARINLRVVSGAITVGTAAATAVQAGGAANIIRNIRLSAKNEARLDVTGFELALLHRIMNQNSLIQTDPALTTGDKTFEFCVSRQFVMPRMFAPTNQRGILPNKLIRDVQLIIDIGAPSEILNPDTTTTLAYKTGTSLEISVYSAVPTPADPDFYINEQVFAIRNSDVIKNTGEQEIRLNTFGKYRALIVYAKTLSTTTYAMTDSALSELKLMANKTEIDRRTWGAIQADNRQQYLLTSALPGVAVLDFTQDGDPSQLLDADQVRADGSDLSLYATVASAATAGTIGIVGVRCWDNPKAPLIPPVATK
jgi:hypothetical protein